MTNFKGTKGEWSVYYNEYGHITSVRSELANRVIFTSKVNNMDESNSNMILAQHAPEMLECIEDLLKELRYHGFNNSNSIYKAEELIKKATE